MDQVKVLSEMLGIKVWARMEFYHDHPRPLGYFPHGAPYQKRETVIRYEDGSYSCTCLDQVAGTGLTNCIHMVRALSVPVTETGKFWRIEK